MPIGIFPGGMASRGSVNSDFLFMSIEEHCVDDWENKVSKGGTDVCMVSLLVSYVENHRNDVRVKVKARVVGESHIPPSWCIGNW